MEHEIEQYNKQKMKYELDVENSEKQLAKLKQNEEEMLVKLKTLQLEQQSFEHKVKKLNNQQGQKQIDFQSKSEEIRSTEEAIRKFQSTNSADHEKQLKKALETAKQELAETQNTIKIIKQEQSKTEVRIQEAR